MVIHLDRMRSLNLASGILVLASMVGMALLAIERGPWLDEFFTIWMTDPAIPLETIYRERWATDLHPPLYYASVWALRHVVPDDLALLRLANAFPLLIIVPTALAWRARRPTDSWGPVFAGLVMCCPYFVSYFAELRSYFDVMAVTAALIMQLRILRWQTGDLSRSDRRLGLLIAVTIVVALNLHFIASVVIAIIIGVEMLRLARVRHWRSAALLAMPSLLGALLLALSLAYLLTNTQPFSLFPAGPLAYLKMVAAGVLLGFALNVGVDLALVAALLKRPRRATRGAGWSAVGLLLAMAFLFVEGLVGNSMTLRYTLVLIPPAAGLAADLASETLAESRLKIGLFLLGGAGLLIAGVTHEITNKRWLSLAEPIAAAVRACPATPVIAVDHDTFIPPSQRQPVAGGTEVYGLGYRWVAALHGIDVTLTRANADTVIAPGPCPTLLWSAHDFGNLPDPFELARRARIRFVGHSPRVTNVVRTRDQRLIIFSAAQPSNRPADARP